jgi:hypothetical protein
MVDGKLDLDAVGFLIRDTNNAISNSLQKSDLPPERRAELLKEINSQYGNAGEALTLSSLEDILTALMIFQVQSAQDRKSTERQMNIELRSAVYQQGMEIAEKTVEKGKLEANSMIAQAAINFGTTLLATGVSLYSAHKAETKRDKTIKAAEDKSSDVMQVDTQSKTPSSIETLSQDQIDQAKASAEKQFQKDMQVGDAWSKLIMATGNFAASMVGGTKMTTAELEGSLQRDQTLMELTRSVQQSVQGGVQDAAKAQEAAMNLLQQMLNNLHQGAMAIRIA